MTAVHEEPPLDRRRLKRLSGCARVECQDEVDSTNDEARRALPEHRPGERWLFAAERQTAGRGRGTNRWWTGSGALALSLVADASAYGIDPRRMGLVALAGGIAVIEAIERLVGPAANLGLHWPNDIFADARKLGGLLVESPAPGRVIVGLGINVNTCFDAAPDEVRRRATSLVERFGRPIDRTELTLAWIERLDDWLDVTARDPEAVARRADQVCLQHGRVLTIDEAGTRHTGPCEGIDTDGALVLALPSGRRRFLAGALIHEPAG